MKIEQNGFYKLSQIYERNIEIGNDIVIAIFDDCFNEVNISIGENSKVEFYGFYGFEKNIGKINFYQNNSNSTLIVKYLLLSQNDKNRINKKEFKIYSNISSNNCKSLLNIISLVMDKSSIDIDGVINIDKGLKEVEGNLKEENLFMGDFGTVIGKPILQVSSNDVQAGHSCKIERISDEKLFYLTSRGLSSEKALSIMLESKIKNLFSCLGMIDKIYYEGLIDRILSKLK